MSAAPIVIRCECQGLFQLPQSGMARAICPLCKREVAILANGTAQVVHAAVESPELTPISTQPASANWNQPNWNAPASNPLPQVKPGYSQGGFGQPNSYPSNNPASSYSPNSWNPSSPAPKKSYAKVIVISLVVGLVAVVGCIALCAGIIYTQFDNQVNKVMAWSFQPGEDAAPVEQLEAKPLVLSSEYMAVEKPLAQQQGKEMRMEADSLKSEEEFEEAEKAYLEALRLDPTDAMAAYQLACNYELWGDTAKAKKSFDHAMSLGFADYPTCLDDDELGEIREMADFDGILEQIRVRYIAQCKNHVGTPVLFDPPGGVSKGLMILMHGYGDSHESYFDEAMAWNALGFRAVAMPGSIPHLDGKFSWSISSTEITFGQIQKILSDPRIAQRNEKVYLMGFSQGGMHAMQVAAMHPDRIAGAIVMSPGGQPWMGKDDMGLKLTGQGRFYFTYGDQEMHGRFMPMWQADCKKAGWKSMLHIHNGGHHFPRDWDTRRTEVANFLLSP